MLLILSHPERVAPTIVATGPRTRSDPSNQSGARVLRVDERLAELRAQPRFAEVARRLGL
jgi:hypothetical protein